MAWNFGRNPNLNIGLGTVLRALWQSLLALEFDARRWNGNGSGDDWGC